MIYGNILTLVIIFISNNQWVIYHWALVLWKKPQTVYKINFLTEHFEAFQVF